VIVAINKMDLVGFSEDVFMRIRADYAAVAAQLGLEDITYIPICAVLGDNIVDPSTSMPWYAGQPLLDVLEQLELTGDINLDVPRLSVQYVIRPQSAELHDYRGYAGRISSGIYRTGDPVIVLPAAVSTTIARIEIAGVPVEEAFAPQSVVIHLTDDIDVSRGDMIVHASALPQVSAETEVLLCWLDGKPLQAGQKYLLQHHSRLVRVVVREIGYRVDVNTLERTAVDGPVRLNEVVQARIRSAAPLVYDAYADLKSNGAAILIDETGHSTVAALMFQ
jgi:sulfate adenylyltransferase subunit 1